MLTIFCEEVWLASKDSINTKASLRGDADNAIFRVRISTNNACHMGSVEITATVVWVYGGTSLRRNLKNNWRIHRIIIGNRWTGLRKVVTNEIVAMSDLVAWTELVFVI